jgi:hypothetical protein
MSEPGKITASHLSRTAVIYVRQSTLIQVERNTERVIRNSPAQAFADLHLIVSKVPISARRA